MWLPFLKTQISLSKPALKVKREQPMTYNCVLLLLKIKLKTLGQLFSKPLKHLLTIYREHCLATNLEVFIRKAEYQFKNV